MAVGAGCGRRQQVRLASHEGNETGGSGSCGIDRSSSSSGGSSFQYRQLDVSRAGGEALAGRVHVAGAEEGLRLVRHVSCWNPGQVGFLQDHWRVIPDE